MPFCPGLITLIVPKLLHLVVAFLSSAGLPLTMVPVLVGIQGEQDGTQGFGGWVKLHIPKLGRLSIGALSVMTFKDFPPV